MLSYLHFSRNLYTKFKTAAQWTQLCETISYGLIVSVPDCPPHDSISYEDVLTTFDCPNVNTHLDITVPLQASRHCYRHYGTATGITALLQTSRHCCRHYGTAADITALLQTSWHCCRQLLTIQLQLQRLWHYCKPIKVLLLTTHIATLKNWFQS